MIRNQGGNMMVSGAILMLMMGCLAMLYIVKSESRKPSEQTMELVKSVESVFVHIGDIEKTEKEFRERIEELEKQIGGFDRRQASVEVQMQEYDGDLDQAHEHLSRVREQLANIKDYDKRLATALEKKFSHFEKNINVKLHETKTIGYERIVKDSKGRRVKQMVYKTRPYTPKEKEKKYNMPVVKESKFAMDNAGL